jgi:hypothetical protein
MNQTHNFLNPTIILDWATYNPHPDSEIGKLLSVYGAEQEDTTVKMLKLNELINRLDAYERYTHAEPDGETEHIAMARISADVCREQIARQQRLMPKAESKTAFALRTAMNSLTRLERNIAKYKNALRVHDERGDMSDFTPRQLATMREQIETDKRAHAALLARYTLVDEREMVSA